MIAARTARPLAVMLALVLAPALVSLTEHIGSAAPPTMTRAEIIAIAKTGVGCPYVWGGTCWNPDSKTWKGADCSGYVTKCWQIPSASLVTACTSHYYSTSNFYYQATYWSALPSWSSLLQADAIVHRTSSSGHIVLFDSTTSTSGCFKVYEAKGSSYGIVYNTKCPTSDYKGIRRTGLTSSTTPTNTPPTGKLESASCSVIKGWAQDPDAKTSTILVHLYFDGTPGSSGATVYSTTANVTRSDLCSPLGSCNHGFEFTTPSKLKDGKPHTVHAYGMDTAGGTNPELTGSPMTLTCSTGDGGGGEQAVPLDQGQYWPTGDVPLEAPEDPMEATISGSIGCSCSLAAAPSSSGEDRSLSGVAAAIILLVVAALFRATSRRRRAQR